MQKCPRAMMMLYVVQNALLNGQIENAVFQIACKGNRNADIQAKRT